MENKQVVQTKNAELSLSSTEGARALYQIANMLASSDIIPDTFKNKPANVLIALNMANRLKADPLMVMQNMYVVYGNPSWSSKFLIATFNTCGKFTSIKYEFFGKQGTDEYGCRAYATELSSQEIVRSIDVTLGMAKAEGWSTKKGSKWSTMPQLMLQYRAATFLIRTVAPEISMGLMTSEELEDIQMVQGPSGTYTADVETAKEKIDTEIQTTEAKTVDIPVEMPVEEPAPEPVKKRPF